MSARDENQAELMEGELFDRRLAIFTTERNAVLSNDPRAMSGLCNSLLDHFTNSAVLPQLVRLTLSTGAQVAGLELVKEIIGVMQADAEVEALRQLAAEHAEAAADPENGQPRTRARAALLERMNE